jgi:gluconate 5-dehydrogenase
MTKAADKDCLGGPDFMSDLFDLGGKLALVTGSSQGIGLALAEGLAAHGARVVINGRDEAKVEKAVQELTTKGYVAFGAAFDVTNASVGESVDRIEREIGPIEILINNAGMQFRSPLEDFPADKWEELLRTNISSVFYTARRWRGI